MKGEGLLKVSVDTGVANERVQTLLILSVFKLGPRAGSAVVLWYSQALWYCGTPTCWYTGTLVLVVVHWYTGAGTRAGVAPKLALQAHKSSTLAATKPDN